MVMDPYVLFVLEFLVMGRFMSENINNQFYFATIQTYLYSILILQKRRPPSFFSNLHECLKIMIRSFCQDDKEFYTSETLKRVEYLLKIHGMETRELIHQYHLERWQEQQAITEPKMGVLTVRAQFIDDNIKVEIMNARNLLPTDSNG